MTKAEKKFLEESNEEKTEIKLLLSIQDSLQRILDVTPHRKYYTIKDICKEYKVSKRTVIASIWLQPNYGISDLPGREKKWLPETYKSWFRISPTIHRRELFKMDREKRMKLVR